MIYELICELIWYRCESDENEGSFILPGGVGYDAAIFTIDYRQFSKKITDFCKINKHRITKRLTVLGRDVRKARGVSKLPVNFQRFHLNR